MTVGGKMLTRIVSAGLLTAVGLGGVVLPAAADTPPPLCQTKSLSISQQPRGVAAGTRFEDLIVTNKGRTCVIAGYPGLVFRDADGQVLPAQIVPDTLAPLNNVVLNTGDTARSRLALFDIPTDPDPSGPVTPATLKVTTPGSSSSTTVPWTFGDLQYPYTVTVDPFAVTDWQ